MKNTTKKDLEKAFTYLTVLNLGSYLLYDDLELYNTNTGETKQYKTIDDVLADKEIKEKIDKLTFYYYYMGGRGASSGQMGGGFTSAGGEDSDSKNTYSASPAEFNSGGRKHNIETVLNKFVEKYGNADREYAVSVDSQGFAHSYRVGGAHSVRISAAGKGHTIIHNHPNGGNFSSADLLNLAGSKNQKGVIATNRKGYYDIQKSHNFNAKGFSKAVSRAQWPKKLSYDEGADWWLKKNQKKYGYKYGYKTIDKSKVGNTYENLKN